jgi:hypothetical protein
MLRGPHGRRGDRSPEFCVSIWLCDSNRAKMVVKQSERHWVDALSLPDFAPNDLIRQCLLGHLYAVFGPSLSQLWRA